MVKLIRGGVYYQEGRIVKEAHAFMTSDKKEKAVRGTISYKILHAHGAEEDGVFHLRFDALVSHDITYVNIIQTARACGMTKFPLPYTLTNCHNSLCAVGGTVNGDDHAFGLSAAKKYGGDFVPAHLAVIHQYEREMAASCGKMILGSDSHTRYGALGTLGVGEGGGELVKQLLGQTYDLPHPDVVAVYLRGKLRKGVGAQDVALSIIKAVYKNGFAKNKILEFIGPGIANLTMDERNGIDVMTTETACLSSVWETDACTEAYFRIHGREGDFHPLHAEQPAFYDAAVIVDLTRIEPMIALPFHPSNAYPIREFLERAPELLAQAEEAGRKLSPTFSLKGCLRDGKVYATQAVVAGCAGGSYENISEMAEILRGGSVGNGEFSLSVYPASVPIRQALEKNGSLSSLTASGAVIHPSFCGPCFGAGDVPSNNGLSIRHVTRNFENREGSRPGEGQFAAVFLMDARSIAATARNGGAITSALGLDYSRRFKKYTFDGSAYAARVYHGAGAPLPETPLVFGPSIGDWPEQLPLGKHLLLKVASVLTDPVTTTDELIPSGETSVYRSDPVKLSGFALSRKDPCYVARAREIAEDEQVRRKEGSLPTHILDDLGGFVLPEGTMYGSVIVSNRPGDGSAREQAASCQRVLGGVANICAEYATKRYRSNLINWGILPLTAKKRDLLVGDYIFLEGIAEAIANGEETLSAVIFSKGKRRTAEFSLGHLTPREREILLDGCLINFYRKVSK